MSNFLMTTLADGTQRKRSHLSYNEVEEVLDGWSKLYLRAFCLKHQPNYELIETHIPVELVEIIMKMDEEETQTEFDNLNVCSGNKKQLVENVKNANLKEVHSFLENSSSGAKLFKKLREKFKIEFQPKVKLDQKKILFKNPQFFYNGRQVSKSEFKEKLKKITKDSADYFLYVISAYSKYISLENL